MWKLKIAEGGNDPYIYSTNNFLGWQIWEFDPQADSPEELAEVEKARQHYWENRFQVRPSSDLLLQFKNTPEDDEDQTVVYKELFSPTTTPYITKRKNQKKKRVTERGSIQTSLNDQSLDSVSDKISDEDIMATNQRVQTFLDSLLRPQEIQNLMLEGTWAKGVAMGVFDDKDKSAIIEVLKKNYIRDLNQPT